jgi:ankyrin repeat protein
MIAALNNSAPMIGLLMDAGADPSLKNAQGKTAEGVADLNDHQEASQAIRVLSLTQTSDSPQASESSESRETEKQ